MRYNKISVCIIIHLSVFRVSFIIPLFKYCIRVVVSLQRYFVNSDFYKSNGPVFLMIGAEGIANATWMVEGQWIEYAKEFGALCFYVEHRFYGKSHPTPYVE